MKSCYSSGKDDHKVVSLILYIVSNSNLHLVEVCLVRQVHHVKNFYFEGDPVQTLKHPVSACSVKTKQVHSESVACTEGSNCWGMHAKFSSKSQNKCLIVLIVGKNTTIPF